jgi:hypothetical protein
MAILTAIKEAGMEKVIKVRYLEGKKMDEGVKGTPFPRKRRRR